MRPPGCFSGWLGGTLAGLLSECQDQSVAVSDHKLALAVDAVFWTFEDVHDSVKPGGLEYLEDLGRDVGKDEPAAPCPYLLVQTDELTQGVAGQEFHAAEVEGQGPPAHPVGHPKQLGSDVRDIVFAQTQNLADLTTML